MKTPHADRMTAQTSSSKQTKIHSRAPTRIDLAGGTLDIWPIHLLLGEPSTLNLGIDLCAETEISWIAGTQPGIRLCTEDQGAILEFPWSELATRDFPPTLELHGKFLRHFARLHPARTEELAKRPAVLELKTRARSPAGAGLGGSSTLSIAILGALHELYQPGVQLDAATRTRLIEIARDIETTVIKVPAGLQDYHGAAFGGLQLLTWGVASHRREALPKDVLQDLTGRLLLFYSGQSRNSGINNWVLFKAFIDGNAAVRDQFRGIARATDALHAALLKKDWAQAGKAIAQEWSIRRNFASGISTPEIDHAFETAFSLGATAGKICGAGGGGCFFVWMDDEDTAMRTRIVERLQALGMRHLPFEPVEGGLEVRTSRD